MGQTLYIAVADDDPDTREFYREGLARLGHEVAVACDGPQLVDMCREVRPDLIVTDLEMPGLNGIEAAGLVCREGAVPIVFVTGRPVEAAPEAGSAVVVLRKPVSMADLEAAVVRLSPPGG